MRIILAVLTLALFARSAQATTFTFELDQPSQSGTWQIQLQADPADRFNAQISANGGPTINGPDTTFDPAAYSTTTLTLSVIGDGYLVQTFYVCSEFDFHCSRADRTSSTGDFIVGDETLTVSASEQISGPYAFYAPLSITVSIPDDLNAFVVGVPEPSTWAMLLIGFAGISATLKLSPRLPSGQRWCRHRASGRS
jgi:hypothetical protein